jgi:hypothetical protein
MGTGVTGRRVGMGHSPRSASSIAWAEPGGRPKPRQLVHDRSSALEAVGLQETEGARAADDDVVDDRSVEQYAGVDELPRHGLIIRRRDRVAARVIVDEDDGGGAAVDHEAWGVGAASSRPDCGWCGGGTCRFTGVISPAGSNEGRRRARTPEHSGVCSAHVPRDDEWAVGGGVRGDGDVSGESGGNQVRGEHGPGAAGRGNHAVREDDDPVGVRAGEVQVVEHHERRGAARGERVDCTERARLLGEIEARDRLIQE